MQRIRFIAATVGWPGLVSFASLFAAWTATAFLISGNLRLAVASQICAFLLDSLDGFLARKLGVVSDFGRQLDSMIDAFNYSLFAALLTMLWLLPGALGFVVGFLILALGILRLVLFNISGYVTEGDRLYYLGVVTPHLTLASGLLFFAHKFWPIPDWAMAVVLVVLAFGQLSKVRTRKTGALAFWLPASVLLGIGALLWL
jgi:CDP-diacylglycerol--serine O-phosphatidyltransferase